MAENREDPTEKRYRPLYSSNQKLFIKSLIWQIRLTSKKAALASSLTARDLKLLVREA